MTKTIERFDTVRLDHFIGFYNYYAFPGVDARPQDDALWREEREKARQYATHPDDEDGWTPGPQEKFFDAIFEVAPREALVAEDLGVMNQGVRDLRDSLDLPGMRVLQFSFDSVAPGAPDPTREWPLRSVAYTGTHDGAPIVGWIDDVRRYGKRFWKTLDFDALRDVLMRHKRPYDLPAPSRPTSLLARLRDLFRKDRPILGIAQYDRPAPLTVLELHAPALRSVSNDGKELELSVCEIPLAEARRSAGKNIDRAEYLGASVGFLKFKLDDESLPSNTAPPERFTHPSCASSALWNRRFFPAPNISKKGSIALPPLISKRSNASASRRQSHGSHNLTPRSSPTASPQPSSTTIPKPSRSSPFPTSSTVSVPPTTRRA